MIEVYHEMERVARFFCAHCFDEHYFDLFKMNWKSDEELLYIRFSKRDLNHSLIDRAWEIKTFGKYEHLRKGVETVALRRGQLELFDSILTVACGITEWEPLEKVDWVEEKNFATGTLFDNGEIFLETERFDYSDGSYIDSVDFGWKYNESVTKKQHFRNMKNYLFGSDHPFISQEFFINKQDATKIKSAVVWLFDNTVFDEKRGGMLLK